MTELGAPRRRPWVLRVVLSYSRKGYSEAVFHQKTQWADFDHQREHTFRLFQQRRAGGVKIPIRARPGSRVNLGSEIP